MRRVVVTGLGIVSSIGNNADEVTASLRDARSGISFSQDFADHGFKCQVWGAPNIDTSELVDRRAARFLSQGGSWNHVAMKQAIADSGLEEAEYSANPRAGIIMGSGGPSTRTLIEAAEITVKNNSPKRIGPFAVPKAMSSTASATLATWFKIHGVNYSISSACSTSAHCIGNAAEMIQWGKQDIMFAGGHEDLDWTMSNLFDAMGAMSSKYNDTPATASRAYDVSRAVDLHGADAERLRRPDDAHRDLAVVGNEDRTDAHASTSAMTWPAMTGSSFSTRKVMLPPSTPAGTSWKVFMTSMSPIASPLATASPSALNGGTSGEEAR